MTLIDRHVGSKLRGCRIARGLSEAELGSATSINPEQISGFESGAARPSAEQLMTLTETLGVPAYVVFEGYNKSE
jgi:transcriptional regulator with XRE-family HTH domain